MGNEDRKGLDLDPDGADEELDGLDLDLHEWDEELGELELDLDESDRELDEFDPDLGEYLDEVERADLPTFEDCLRPRGRVGRDDWGRVNDVSKATLKAVAAVILAIWPRSR